MRYYKNGREVSKEEFYGDAIQAAARLEEMFASGQAPASRTDREFLRGHCNGNQFEKHPGLGNYLKGVAREHGLDPKGKVYLGSLAAFPGDPRAWVDGRGDAQRVVEERGWGCSGAVNVKVREPLEAPKEVAVAEDIVAGQVERRLAELHPADAARVDKGELAHSVTEQLKPHWA
jgi:hypothetical protein